MAKLIDLDEQLYLRLLVYGLAGSGKTRTAGSASLDPRTSPMLMLNAGGNPISLRDYNPRPDIIEVTELKDLNAPYDFIIKGQPPSHPLVKQFGLRPPYRSLGLDSLSEFQRLSFAQVVGTTDVNPGDIPRATEIQHFGRVLAQMTNLAKLYFNLPIHVIATALEQNKTNAATGSMHFSPLLWGQSNIEVPGYAWAVARLVHPTTMKTAQQKAIEQQYGTDVSTVAQFKPSGRMQAKDQYGRLPDIMVSPTIGKILDLILEDAS